MNRKKIDTFLNSRIGHKTILASILLNALAVALQTSDSMVETYGPALDLIEWVTIGLFILENIFRLYAERMNYFKQGWNIFDIFVITISLLPHDAGLSILRSFRIIKSLSVLEASSHTRNIINTVVRIWPRVFVVLILMGLSFFILGVVGVELYKDHFPELFGDLSVSMFTLFSLMQSDNASDTIKAVMEIYPYSWVYFIVVTVVLAFVMMNLFVGIIVDAMQGAVEDEIQDNAEVAEKNEDTLELIKKEVLALRSEVKSLSQKLN